MNEDLDTKIRSVRGERCSSSSSVYRLDLESPDGSIELSQHGIRN